MMPPTEPRPLLAITLGDPAGVGPEIIVKALARVDLFARCRPLVIGDKRMLARAATWCNLAPPEFEVLSKPGEGTYRAGTIPVLDLHIADPELIPAGSVSPEGGRAAVEAVFAACDLAMAGEVDAIVTAPLNKEAMNRAGFAFAGHTELLAERTHAQHVSMLLIGEGLRVVHVSTHVSLRDAIERVTTARVEEVIDLAQYSCNLLGIANPRIAVAGLNPHAGEGGLFGSDEQRIRPAIAAARARGLNVSDPLPPDTVFLRSLRDEFDIVVAMYHDQGHIPMKLLAFESGVNVSIGLPIIRTSVDHGTAFDIAGKGIASERSLLAALDVAGQMVRARAALPV
jgi:4-hydroxythreonine-4-phosphate dehydrogenase